MHEIPGHVELGKLPHCTEHSGYGEKVPRNASRKSHQHLVGYRYSAPTRSCALPILLFNRWSDPWSCVHGRRDSVVRIGRNWGSRLVHQYLGSRIPNQPSRTRRYIVHRRPFRGSLHPLQIQAHTFKQLRYSNHASLGFQKTKKKNLLLLWLCSKRGESRFTCYALDCLLGLF